MNKFLAFFSITLALTLFTGIGAAQEIQNPDAKNTDRLDLEVRDANLLDRLTNNALSVSLNPSTVERGGEVTGSIYGDITGVSSNELVSGGACDGDKVDIKISWYRPDGSYAAGDWVTADECSSFYLDYSFSVWTDAEYGEWTVQADYRHEEIGDLNGPKVYDFGSDTYEVVESSNNEENEDDEDTGTEPEPDPEADVSLYQTPDFTVDDDSNTVTGTLGIQNTGDGDMPDSDIVEMQVRPQGENPLSFTSSTNDVCDSSYENNVHKDYSIDAGDSREITLENQGELVDGESYTVYFLTREGCAPDNEKVEPIYNSYNAGVFTLNDESSGDDSGNNDDSDSGNKDQEVVQVSKPQVSYNDGTISTTVNFKNNGGDMPDQDIVEMQVRPQGETPLSFSNTQQVCDNDFPENVHKNYQFNTGETGSTTLSTDAVTEPGTYTVYLLTREGCAPDNGRVDPYPNSINAGTVTIEDTGGSGRVNPGTGGNLVLILAVISGTILVATGLILRWG